MYLRVPEPVVAPMSMVAFAAVVGPPSEDTAEVFASAVTVRMPALIVVLPVYVLAVPVRASSPVPALMRPAVLVTVPLKVVLRRCWSR